MAKKEQLKHWEEVLGIYVSYGVEEFTENFMSALKANCKGIVPKAQRRPSLGRVYFMPYPLVMTILSHLNMKA
jgi:hypothetical protein